MAKELREIAEALARDKYDTGGGLVRDLAGSLLKQKLIPESVNPGWKKREQLLADLSRIFKEYQLLEEGGAFALDDDLSELAGLPFHEIVRKLRLSRGVTQTFLAQRVGLDITHFNKVEKGRRPPPHISTILGIARELRLSLVEQQNLLVSAGLNPEKIMILDRDSK